MIRNATYSVHIPRLQTLPVAAWVLLGVLTVLGLISANPVLSVYAILVELAIFFLLWVPGQPPLFFLLLSLQWAQASTRIWQANLESLPLEEFANSMNAVPSNWIALNSLLAFSLVCGWIIRRSRFSISHLRAWLQQVELRKALIAYLAGLLVVLLLKPLSVGGLSQVILALQSFKWALFILFFLAALEQRKYFGWVVIAFVFELISGFGGVFSSFRDVIFITLICLGTIWYKPNVKRILWGIPLILGVAILFVVWNGVKGEYREFQTGSTFSQHVLVSKNEAYVFLWDLLKDFSADDFKISLEASISRLQYTEMIQMAMDYVPASIPHENGKLWGEAIQHVLFPRFLFPDKPILDDSAVMRKYTGYDWVIPEGAASISLGYIAESYVDFGRGLFFIPPVFLAFLFSAIYLFFLSTKNERILLDVGAVIVILLNFQLIERTGAKILGGTIMPLIIYLVIIRPFIYKPILKFILKTNPNRTQNTIIPA